MKGNYYLFVLFHLEEYLVLSLSFDENNIANRKTIIAIIKVEIIRTY